MTDAVVFAGPSLSSAPLPEGWLRLPPAGRDDVLRALVRNSPRVIGLIDGWIHDRPAVGHRELLLALAKGVTVIGAGGMGAIRAVELRKFGMIGIGEVYDAYLAGTLVGDDEVAVSTEGGLRPLSVPLVDVRASLSDAVEAGITAVATAEHLVAVAKGIHYSERTYSRLFAIARAEDGGGTELDRIENWVSSNARSAKSDDAVMLVDAIAAMLREGGARPTGMVRPANQQALDRLYKTAVKRAELEQSTATRYTILKVGDGSGITRVDQSHRS